MEDKVDDGIHKLRASSFLANDNANANGRGSAEREQDDVGKGDLEN
jgi:hypothetical protein